jgi:hypothetical protein
MEYRVDLIEIRNSNGTVVADLSGRCISRKLSFKRNQADTIELDFDLDNISNYCKLINSTIWDLFIVNSSEIRIYRDTKLITAGQICYAYPSISGDTRKLKVKAVGWFDLLSYRYTGETKEFSSEDAGDIAWTLINESQQQTNGDFGFTEGIIQPSKNRDRSYSYKNIKDAIVQLSEVIDGFDFEITPDKVFNVYYPKIGTKRDDLVFTYPGNIQNISFERDGTKMSNKVIGIGAGTGINATRSLSEDTTSQSIYQLREKVIQLPDISNQDTLEQHTDSETLIRGAYLDLPDILLDGNIDPKFGEYNVGDEIKIQITEYEEAFEKVKGWWRIEAIDLDIDENNHEDVRLRVMR